MTDHPFLSIVAEALNLMHPRFAAAHGREYTAAEADEPPAARKARERSFGMEFYSEFRRMWDKAVPVQRGLGHVLVQGDPDAPARQPDLLFWQLGERGAPDRRLAAVSLVFRSNPAAVAADLKLLARFRDLGYALAVCVLIGRATDPDPEPTPGVTPVRFDVEKWQVVRPTVS
ncbi:unnamed protein product [Gemmataceae bacterium]|nr:unnamed protein product [Gemmataceae bacterium]VTU01593.1 unnamed protein product [Gemmataceae bacterium]